MDFSIARYCDGLLAKLLDSFQDRLCYMGLQGSYLRGEATDSSDIDIVVILDKLGVEELTLYRNILEGMEAFDRSCGFIASKEDILHWNPLESCQLLYSTKDIYGHLEDYLPSWTLEDERNYCKLSLNNLYHVLCHSYIHGDHSSIVKHLPGYYKAAYFILQNTHYLDTCPNGEFILPKKELTESLEGVDRAIMETVLSFQEGAQPSLSLHYPPLLYWCQNKLKAL